MELVVYIINEWSVLAMSEQLYKSSHTARKEVKCLFLQVILRSIYVSKNTISPILIFDVEVQAYK